jgi:hypothetical protein
VAQLLFAESLADTVLVDAVVLEGSTLPSGTPVTLRLQPPESALIAELVRNRLVTWAEEAAVVSVELRRRARATTAVVSDGRSAVSLDIRTPLVA